jgi:hypothetical protein
VDAICVCPALSLALDHGGRDNGSHDEASSRTEAIPWLPLVNNQSERRIRMPLINLVIVLLVVGVLLWLVNTYIPMDRKIKNILNIVVVIVVVIWLLQVFGVLGSMDSIRIGR